MGSISKPLATWVVLRVLEVHGVDPEQPAGPFASRWRIPPGDYREEEITFARLLSHAAGVDVAAVPAFPADSIRPSLEDGVSGRADGKGAVMVERRPGAQWVHSGGGFTVLELAVEEIGRQAFTAAARG